MIACRVCGSSNSWSYTWPSHDTAGDVHCANCRNPASYMTVAAFVNLVNNVTVCYGPVPQDCGRLAKVCTKDGPCECQEQGFPGCAQTT